VDKREQIKAMLGASSKEELWEMLSKQLDENPSQEAVGGLISRTVDMISALCGPKKWEESDPVTIAAKIPQEIIDIAFLLRDKFGINTAAFLEEYVRRLMMLGLASLSRETDDVMQEMLGVILKNGMD